MKIIRTTAPTHVPVNPENPDTNVMRLVQTGLVALVPSGFQVPPEKQFIDLGKVKLKEDKKES